MTPRICVSILPKTSVEAVTLIKRAQRAKASLIEVRLDRLKELENLWEISKNAKVPLIATNRLLSERGFFAGTETERQRSLLCAAQEGFKYVDVDLESQNHQETIDKLRQLGAKPIVSHHKPDGALGFPEMDMILKQEIACGADICKIVGAAEKIEDNLAVLNFVASRSGKAKLVCFCMGEAGKVSRVLSPMFGAYLTFATLEKGGETAAGQMTIKEMTLAYNLLGAN